MSTHDHTEEHHTGLREYAAVCLTLFVLTAVTVYVAKFDFGDFNIVIAMLVASVKAAIVALYFMHLKFEDKLTWIYALYPLFLLFLLIGFTIMETFTRVPVIK
ncbi:MAG: cytochrome C oxidase subunit IV family protein [Candidatus Dadabacteria bacterium]|nr:cytochrome C oxidase subunit IV family protein [Candidatus Dadabacteria bacterium]MDE0520142.1 cytochrome C oxidase subunit IV family protein [Candidatus Dadabacteria bacterium]MDE0662822.1 cytochrome C oxidase subunit IV family protein [Candidatus Dadabacteria bacterium]